MLLRWTHHDPAREFRGIERQMDDIFRSLFPNLRTTSDVRSNPAFSIYETDDAYRLEAELPGFAEGDLSLEATDDGLTIKGVRKLEAPEGYQALRRERGALQFARTFRFRAKLDVQHVSASLKDGILSIELGKQAATQPRQIAIQAA